MKLNVVNQREKNICKAQVIMNAAGFPVLFVLIQNKDFFFDTKPWVYFVGH